MMERTSGEEEEEEERECECVGQKWKRERETEGDEKTTRMDSSTLTDRGTLPTSHAERSPLN